MAIETDVLSPRQIFKDNVVYAMPEYQRGYVWKQDEQWEPLWDDVQNLAEEWLGVIMKSEQVGASDAPSHFLGAVVFQQENNMPGKTEVFKVIDGQQRLTTLQILLDAVQERAAKDGLKRAKELEALILNKENEDDPFKIRPTAADQESFRHAMDDELTTEKHKRQLIVMAHEYFGNRAVEWLESNTEGTKEQRSEALYIALAELLKVVVITVGHKDDPQIIFETLNARGTPLLQSELVKNYLIYRADKKLPASHMQLFNDTWFGEEVRQGSMRHPRIDQFLFYWITMRTAKDINVGDIFREFKKYESAKDTTDIAKDMQVSSEHYHDIECPPDNSPFKVFLERSRILGIGVNKPLLLWLLLHAENQYSPLERVATALESYLVRRAVVGRTAAGLNRTIVEILSALREVDNAERGAQIIIEHLKKQQGHRAWPSDEHFRKEFCTRHLYGWMAKRKITMLLGALNDKLGEANNFTEQTSTDHNTLTIEHIMPQHWQTEDWSLPQADGEIKAGVVEKRNELIHTMGNLTLVTQELNSKMADRSWENKRKELREHSILFLNKDLCERDSPDVWSEDAIMERASDMAKAAIEIWPSPDSF